MERMLATNEFAVVSTPAPGQTSFSMNELPVGDESCLSLCVPILQGTKRLLQSRHSNYIMDDSDLR